MVTTMAELQGVDPVAVVVCPVLIAVPKLYSAMGPGVIVNVPPASTPNGWSAPVPSEAEALL